MRAGGRMECCWRRYCISTVLATLAGSAAGHAPARNLAVISNQFPASGVVLRLTVDSVFTDAAVGSSAVAYAGQPIQALDIRLTAGDTFSTTSATVKLVTGTLSRADAQAGSCAHAANEIGQNVTNMASAGVATTLTSSDTIRSVTLAQALEFRMGGLFRLCYSDVGTYANGNADLLEVSLDVAGVYDDCTAANCLADTTYYCYAGRSSESNAGSCLLSFGGFRGASGKASWSQTWTATYHTPTGIQTGVTEKACGTTPDSTVFCAQDGCSGTDRYIELSGTTASLPATQQLTSVRQGYTLAACYCPDLDSCNADAEFVQRVGVLYVFTAKLCDTLNPTTCSTADGYSGVAARHLFHVAVHCAPGACALNANNRIKFVDSAADNDRPAADPLHGCRHATQTSLHISPKNCATATSCSLNGGLRQDYKVFTSDFRFEVTGSRYERRNFHATREVDLCFCSDSCTTAANWFKVGSFVHSPYRLLNVGANKLHTINIAGTIGLYRTSADLDSLGLSTPSSMKILPDPIGSIGDAECGRLFYDTELIPGYDSSASLSSRQGQTYSGDSTSITFGSATNLFTVAKAGYVAVCYCRLTSCSEVSEEWVMAARYVIQGPTTGQFSQFSTGVPVRLTYPGFNLDGAETLRIVPAGTACNDNSGDPVTEASLEVGCPANCAGAVGGMNLATKILSHSTVRCNNAHTECETIYVRRVRVIAALTTEVEFTGDPGLQTGDIVVLGTGLQCGQDCTVEQLAAVSGTRYFGNTGTYSLGLAVTATADAFRFTIPIGWVGTPPKFEVPTAQGQWRRTSSAATAEELKATTAKLSLRVCWGPGGAGTYSTEVGTVTFIAAPIMVAVLSLTGREKDKVAPIIVSFAAGSRSEYNSAVNSMQLKIVFTDTDLLEPYFTNGDAVAALPQWDEHELADANQVACGRLFREMWTQNDEFGFPVPQGCYYKVFGKIRELFILFKPKNGLRAGKTYQLVLNAMAKNGLTTTPKVLEVISMNDVVTAPYSVVESSEESVDVQPLDGPSGTSPRFAEPDGILLMGGTNSQMLELSSQLDLSFQLVGDSTGQIVAGSALRLFMWPLTQWRMQSTTGQGSACTATCTPQAGLTCGDVSACAIEAAVAGQQGNILQLTLPSAMTAISTTVRHTFRVKDVSLPAGGFFASRIGAQVSASGGLQPHYITSSGAYLWKKSDSGQALGQIVVASGDGNSKPFEGDAGNILHLRLVFASIVSTRGAAPADRVGSIIVHMPPGYTCTGVSETPTTLSIFEREKGHGTLDAGSWQCSGATCTYTVAEHAAFFAGASVYASFTVTNPAEALLKADSSNVWSLEERGAGEGPAIHSMAAQGFQAGTGNAASTFGANVAVLGKLTDVVIQPTNFTITTGVFSTSNELFVFFQTKHSTLAGGNVIVDAPESFDFSGQCTATDLASAYYSITSAQTYRLPTVTGCSGLFTNLAATFGRNRAQISLQGRLRAGRAYGFKLQASNPDTYQAAQHDTWRVWTANTPSDLVDGAPDSAAFILANPSYSTEVETGAPRSWGIYQQPLGLPPAVTVSPRLPFSSTGQAALVSVFPLKLASDTVATLRVVAPYGYVWHFTEQTFGYRTVANVGYPSGVVGATADLPGGVPERRNGDTLIWAAASYSASHSYGFFAGILVPSLSPTRASDAFFIEFGYADLAWNANARLAAARVDALPVRALYIESVYYLTNVRGRWNTLRVSFETVTAITAPGGLLLRSPAGIEFPATCILRAVSASSNAALPSDVICSFSQADSGEQLLNMQAGPSGIPAAQYAVEFDATNPSTTNAGHVDESSPCGYDQCWTFYSLANISQGLTSLELDASATSPTFSVVEPMPFAGLLSLNTAGRRAVERDDRPLQSDWLTIAFQLGNPMHESGTLTLLGPPGFVFTEDCLLDGSIRTSFTEIFTGSSTASIGPAEIYSSWESGVPVVNCAGGETFIQLTLGSGLTTGKTYLISLRAASNPKQTPVPNFWTLEASSQDQWPILESSVPFNGFPLWIFTDTSISFLSSAVRAAGATTVNIMNITFTPYSDLSAGGSLVLSAPVAYEFVQVTVSTCRVHLEETDPLASDATAYTVVPSSDLACMAGTNPNVLALQLVAGASGLVAGRTYKLMVRLRNPTTVTTAGATPPEWLLESFEDTQFQIPLDRAYVQGVSISKDMEAWSYSGDSFNTPRVGATVSLVFTMRFPEPLETNDQLTILSPPGWSLEDPSNLFFQTLCFRLSWSGWITSRSPATCTASRMVVVFLEDQTVPSSRAIQLSVSATNPSTQPADVNNYWRIQHTNAAGQLLSSGTVQGWQLAVR